LASSKDFSTTLLRSCRMLIIGDARASDDDRDTS
jgi:hypothetical protein